MATPVIYNLATDYAKFGLTSAQKDILLKHRFYNRVDNDANITGKPKSLVCHIQDGFTVGSLDYWVGVQASSTVMIQRDGSILKVIPEQHGPWTNGDVMSPTDQSYEVRSWGGNPNIWSVTAEVEGHPWEALTPAQFDAVEWWARDGMSRLNIPISLVLPHSAFNQETRANCPGMYYPGLIKRLSGGTTTAYASPDVPSFLNPTDLKAGIDRQLGSVTVYACRRMWQARVDTARRKYADKNSAKIGPDLKAGELFMGEFIFFNSQGGWVLTQYGTRIFMGDLTESMTLKAL